MGKCTSINISHCICRKKLHDGPITLLIVSDDSNSPLSNLNNIPKGVANILVANMSGSSALLAENVTDAIQRACSEASDPFTHVVATASKFGSSFYLGRLLHWVFHQSQMLWKFWRKIHSSVQCTHEMHLSK